MSSESSDEKTKELLGRIAAALERIADSMEAENESFENESFEEEYEGRSQINNFDRGNTEPEIPSEIRLATEEELADQLINFAKEEFPDKEAWFGGEFRLFWAQKNLNSFNAPPEIQLKMKKAERLAENRLMAERQEIEREQLAREKDGLPSLISRCVDWAKENGLKSVRQSDIEAFLLEKEIEIMQPTKRSLYAMTNVALKAK